MSEPHFPSSPGSVELRVKVAQLICCGERCILEGTTNGCILKDPEHDSNLKKADAILAFMPIRLTPTYTHASILVLSESLSGRRQRTPSTGISGTNRESSENTPDASS